MRKFKTILYAGLAFGLAADLALAGINNSHHDLQTWSGGTTVETCFWCHGATDQSQLPNVYTTIGGLCVSRCHGGSLVGADFANSNQPIPNIAPLVASNNSETGWLNADLTALSGGHQFAPSNLYVPNGTATNVNISGAGLPYVGTAQIQCTSCHNVHDNTNSPFLHTDLFAGGPTKHANGASSFCENCHTARGSNWMGGERAPSGEHPVNVALVLGDSTRTLGGRIGRYIQFDDGATYDIFDVDKTTAGAAGDLNDPAVHYQTGGKVSSFGEAVGGNRFGCYTCHVTHQPSTNNLTARHNADTDNAGGVTYNPLCTSCHGQNALATNDAEWNPGLSDAWVAALASPPADGVNHGHPLGTTANAGTNAGGTTYSYASAVRGSFDYIVDLGPIVGPFVQGTNGGGGVQPAANFSPICTSCHDVHGGDADSMVVADLDGDPTNASAALAVCYYCHTGVGLPDVADNDGIMGEAVNAHHRTNTTGVAVPGLWRDGANENDLYIDSTSWSGAAAPTGDTFGDLSDGLECPDCHVGTRDGGTLNGTAHNWLAW